MKRVEIESNCSNVKQGDREERELLEALKDVEDYFRAVVCFWFACFEDVRDRHGSEAICLACNLSTCSAGLDKLPYQAVTCALKSFAKDVRTLRDQQRKERQQKREVDKLARILGRRILCKKQTERNRYGSRILVRRRRVIAVNGFQMRPSKVFSSMVEFFDSMAELFSEADTKRSGRPSKNASRTCEKANDI